MDFGLKERIALVSGASRGLGRSIAEALAAEGARVAICSRNADEIERAAGELEEKNGVAMFGMAADVAKAEEAVGFVTAAAEHFGGLDVLVTNAGGPPATTFDTSTDEQWRSSYELTLGSVVSLVRAALPHMRRNRWGRIINVTSISVKQPIAGLILSNAVRAGVVGLAKSLADELASDGILVNNVCPGYTATERVQSLAETRAVAEGMSKEEIIAGWEEAIPLGRLGQPEELANLVAFLASERAGYITGTTIPVDGGYYRGLM